MPTTQYYEREITRITAEHDYAVRQLQFLMESDLIMRRYDCSRSGPAPLDIWGKGCWEKGQLYAGPFGVYDNSPLLVIYQMGKSKPTSWEEGYYGDWSAQKTCSAELAELFKNNFPDEAP